MTAATAILTALLSGAETDEVLRAVCTDVLGLTCADIVGVLAPRTDDGDALTIVAAVGNAAADLEGVRVPLAGTHVGQVHRSGTARLVRDIRMGPVGGRRATLELTSGYGPALLTPLRTGSEQGLLVTMRAAGRDAFEDSDLHLLSDYATQISVALGLAAGQQRERRLQRQADRDRIARDLHDHVVQRIFATALSLDRLSRMLQPQHEEAAARLARSVDELDETMAEIRSAIFELHQEHGVERGNARHRLADVVHRVTEGQGLQVDVRFRGQIDQLPEDLLPDLLAVLRELVTNVVRHARARRVTVTICVNGEIAVTVADDGVGLPPVSARSGLANLADRAADRGGRLTASSGDAGTEIRWEIPFPVPR